MSPNNIDDADELTPAKVKQASDHLRRIKRGVPIHVIETAEILTDPAWRAWLGKKPKSEQYEDVVMEDEYCQPFLFLDDKTWNSGDKVKVTLEAVEE